MFGQLGITWFPAKRLREFEAGAVQFVDLVHDMDRQADRLGLIGQCALDGRL